MNIAMKNSNYKPLKNLHFDNKIKGFIKFSKQSDRKQSVFCPKNELFSTNSNIISNFDKNVMNFSKYSSRKKDLFKITSTGIQYDPKWGLVEERSDAGIMKFNQISKRNSVGTKFLFLKNPIDKEKIDMGYKFIDKRIQTPNLKDNRELQDNPFGLPKFLIVNGT